MGGIMSNIIVCELCGTEYGENPIFEVFHHGPLGGHCLCVNCYIAGYTQSKMKNKLLRCNIKKTCCNCSFTNKDKESRKVFLVHWYGKYGDKYMCEKCIYDKDFRNKQ